MQSSSNTEILSKSKQKDIIRGVIGRTCLVSSLVSATVCGLLGVWLVDGRWVYTGLILFIFFIAIAGFLTPLTKYESS